MSGINAEIQKIISSRSLTASVIEGLAQEQWDAHRDEAKRAARTGRDMYGYASEAFACERKIGFRIWGTPGGDIDFKGRWAMLGGVLGEAFVVRALDNLYKGEAQVPFADGPVHGRADYLYSAPNGDVVVGEVKMVAPFALKQALKAGPKRDHVAQAMLGAAALDANKVRIVYGCLKEDRSQEPFLDWTINVDPKLTAEARASLAGVVDAIERNELPARMFEGKVIDRPVATRSSGAKMWPCGYCPYLDTCAGLTSGVVPLDGVPTTVGKLPI